MSSAESLYDRVESVPVLIVGAGAAGARAAIALEQNGVTPLVISKRDHGDAHTKWAAGGINAALGSLDEEDTPAIHAADTIDEGHYINDPAAVATVTNQMPERIQELAEWGMDFDRTADGKIDQRYFGAQSFRRTCYVGDRTGEALLETLVSKAQDLNIPYEDNVMITDILVNRDRSRAYGAVGFDMETGETLLYKSNYVILAAGGYSAIYNRHTSRDDENTGDGVALGLRAGACAIDLEFVQFHPTGMVVGEEHKEWSGRLVTEAVRGEGGRLYNADGERFMKEYSPEQMELDARDVVARAIQSEVDAGRGTENGGVYLDISHRDGSFIRKKPPRMYERFQNLGIDLAEEPVEVAPTAHYSMGGLDIDFTTGETDVDRLYAIGETTGGLHGANRLGGNSLAETVAVGKVAGDHIAEEYSSEPREVPSTARDCFHFIENVHNPRGEEDPQAVINRIREIMEEYAGIIRSEEELRAGIEKLDAVYTGPMTNMQTGDKSSLSYEYAHNAFFMYITAKCVLEGALMRSESRGAHYRSDNPDTDERKRQNIVYRTLSSQSDVRLSTREVAEIPRDIEEELEAGHKLEYHHLE